MSIKKELPMLLLIVLPGLYLWYIWSSLPVEVPLHWNIRGEVDRYGSKNELLYLSLLLPAFIYLLFLFIPRIDPKKKMAQMGKKYEQIRIIFMVFTSGIMLMIIHFASNKEAFNKNFILISIGLLFMLLGNYFKTIKPNYFLGIRTPWTLESEEVWKQTHHLGGKLWFYGGLIMTLAIAALPPQWGTYVFIAIITIIVLIPIIYSYYIFKEGNKA